MSSSCPPQLQLTLQPNTTSFKRSFEQFGFDLTSPIEGSEPPSNNGNDRNKRARSETGFSDSTESTQSTSSTLASTSSSSFSPPRIAGDIRTSGVSSDNFGPPRLPTPDIQDIQIAHYIADEHSSEGSFSPPNESRYRLSLESFNAPNNEDTSRASQSSSPIPPRLPASPPVLPPLTISDGQRRLSISSNAISFLQNPSQPTSPLAEAFFDGNSPRATQDSELLQGFRVRLTGALEGVPQSPLVPGLELDDREEPTPGLTGDRSLQESTPLAEPPILPPIPSVSTAADLEQYNFESLLARDEPVHSLSNAAAQSHIRSSISPSLDNPLPSPSLRDLRSWMDGQGRPSNGISNPASRHWHLHNYDSTYSATTDPEQVSRQSSDEEVTIDSSNRTRNATQSPSVLQETSLWQRRSFETGNVLHNETTSSDNGTRQSISRRSSSPVLSGLDPPRLHAFRRRSRLGSSISLVTENSLEARRMVDHHHVMRDLQYGRRRTLEDIEMDEPRNDNPEPPQNDVSTRSNLGRHFLPYLHLPTPSLDVTPAARESEESGGRDPIRGTWPSPPWHYMLSGERRDGPNRLLPESYSFMTEDSGPTPHNGFSFSSYNPRSSSPVYLSPPVAVLPTATLARTAQDHRAPVGDVYNRRPHINLTRHLTLNHRRDPPPLLPQPDFGHAFVTEDHDRDVEMSVNSQSSGVPYGQYHRHSEAPSADYTYSRPRAHREESTPSYLWHSTQTSITNRHPPQFQQSPTLARDSLLRNQRSTVHPVQSPLEIGGGLRSSADPRRIPHYPSSTSPLRPAERMPTLVNIDGEMDDQPPSPHRFVDHRYHPGVSMMEDLDHRQDNLPPYPHTTLDPASFAPGPFRNTIHHTFYPRLNRLPPPPPTIPPLPFEQHSSAPYIQSDSVPDSPPSEESFPMRGPFRQNDSTYTVRLRRPAPNLEHRPPRTPFASSRPSLDRPDDDTTSRRRVPFHSTNQDTASRLAELLSQEPNNDTSSHSSRRYSLPPRNDTMRPGMTAAQFINLVERRRGSDEMAAGPPPSHRPTSNLPPRRFGGGDLENSQSWRTRARGRFRITPDILNAARMRTNMGDFIHDDEFDASYENLLNLAVTIGDAKPKSTPADVLENLEKGVFKDWKTNEGDKRCPICLDDYNDHDILLKLNHCNHWFHQDCLKQWLHTASTCPVCRKSVHNQESSSTSPRRPVRRFGFWRGGPPQPPQPPQPSQPSQPDNSVGGGGQEGASIRSRNSPTSNRWSSPLRRRFD